MIKLDWQQLAIARFLAIHFHENGIDPQSWPEDSDAAQDNYEVVIEEFIEIDCEDQFKVLEDWESDNELTREAFFAWFEDNKDFATRVDNVRVETLAEIERLNKIAYEAVDAAIKLSDEICVPYYCTMPSSVADLDENSSWDASSC